MPDENHGFISHSYGDADALKACLKRRLPRSVKPFVFPAITVTPDHAVSDSLIDAIRSCGLLVYLYTPLSHASFWVGFERNIAARLGKPVFAFRPGRPIFAFARDRRPAADPIVAVLFNLCIREDVETIQRIRETVWDRYRFEIRGDQWRRLDNDARQMLDSPEGLKAKFDAGGVALLFVSTASITASHHDYADPAALRRAQKDMETPIGHTAAKLAGLDRERTLVIWLDQPDRARIERALATMGAAWEMYADVIRRSLADQNKLVVVGPDGGFDLNHLDTMLARCFWAARMGDAHTASRWRATVLDR